MSADGAGGGSLEPIWLGVGSPRPQARLKQNAMFGHVADAFDEKSIFKIGQRQQTTTTQTQTQAAGNDDTTTTTSSQAAAAAAAEDESTAVVVDCTSTSTSTSDDTSNDGACQSDLTLQLQSQLAQPQAGAGAGASAGRQRLLIRGGRVVNDDASFDADVLIVDGKITAIGANLTSTDGARVIDARGKLVMPAGIDSSVHLESSHLHQGCASIISRLVSVDDVYHGTKAALSAGNTTLVDTVVAGDTESLLEAYERRCAVYESKSCCDFCLRVVVTSWSDQVKHDMTLLVTSKGVSGFVLSLPDDSVDADVSLYQAVTHCTNLGALAVIAADTQPSFTALKAAELTAEGITGPEGHLLCRPENMEASNVHRAITVASQANAALCVTNITGKMSADVVARSRRRGKVVFAEVMLAALAFSGSSYYDNSWSRAAAMVTSPPLRPAADTAESLINRLANGEIECVTSDHCAVNMAQKAVGKDDFRLIPAGVNGVAERLPVVWDRAVVSGKMDACRFVAVTSTNAAKLLNVFPRKGRVAVDSDADVIIWDDTRRQSVSVKSQCSHADLNVYDGMSFCGTATHVVYAGQVVVDDEGVHAAEGSGKLLVTPPHSEFVFARVSARDKVQGPQRVERDSSSMPSPADAGCSVHDNAAGTKTVYNDSGMYSRPPTSSGGRNMQDSSFSLSGMSDSGAMDDALKPSKKGCGTKISQPPGGRTSTQLW